MNAKTTAVETDTARAKRTARRKVADLKSSIAHMKHKAGAANRTNEWRFTWTVDLTPQLADMNIDQIRLRQKAIVPDILQKHCPGDDLARTAHEIFQKLELGWQQIKHAGAARVVRSPKKRFDARREFAHVERLGQVIVPSSLEPPDSVIDGCERAHDQHGNPYPFGAQSLNHRQAVGPIEHAVDDQERGGSRAGRGEPFLRRLSEAYGISKTAQPVPDDTCHLRLVFDDQERHVLGGTGKPVFPL